MITICMCIISLTSAISWVLNVLKKRSEDEGSSDLFEHEENYEKKLGRVI